MKFYTLEVEGLELQYSSAFESNLDERLKGLKGVMLEREPQLTAMDGGMYGGAQGTATRVSALVCKVGSPMAPKQPSGDLSKCVLSPSNQIVLGQAQVPQNGELPEPMEATIYEYDSSAEDLGEGTPYKEGTVRLVRIDLQSDTLQFDVVGGFSVSGQGEHREETTQDPLVSMAAQQRTQQALANRGEGGIVS